MTVKQFRRKVEVALRCGMAYLPDKSRLYYDEDGEWTIRDRYGIAVDTAHRPEDLEYLFDKED